MLTVLLVVQWVLMGLVLPLLLLCLVVSAIVDKCYGPHGRRRHGGGSNAR
jgi:hypothetical protein